MFIFRPITHASWPSWLHCSCFVFLLGGVLATRPSAAQIPDLVMQLEAKGDFMKAQQTLRELAQKTDISTPTRTALLFEIERLDRIRKDFRLTEEELLKGLRKDIPDVQAADVARWRSEGALESLMIDGTRYYFGRSIVNLFRLSDEARKRRDAAKPQPTQQVSSPTPAATAPSRAAFSMHDHMRDVIQARAKSSSPYVLPQRYRIHYTLSVNPNVVPPGETIRCWLLYPRECPYQSDIRLISSSPPNARLAPPHQLQRTVYLEQSAVADKPTVFSVTYEYTMSAFYEPVDPAKVKPHDKTSALYKQFTAERSPHLVFTPELRALARQIVGDETNPYLKAKKIFWWIDKNIRYAFAREYSTIPNISMYCYETRHGDCGIQGMLFIVLCRISGVPARWQSGWSVRPDSPTMHDWAEFHIEPYGWLPADPSRGLQDSEDPAIQTFFFGNTDHCRLICNNDFGQPLDPPKTHFRSETVDFQRGEVEWRGGNLYFDQWDWDMHIEQIPTPQIH
jgi:transglutaminase-like putative cysteine protease